ncbi:unnamed protein product [Leptosia nina]|uniref:Uncharacterized protein n=1 Tax=Leptosia nina TaxID=320188 RepID=A0AAV1JWZ3_9NEOP
MEWWVYGPIIVAIIMFLLVGTVFERRIEAAIRRLMERRQEQLTPSENLTTHESITPNVVAVAVSTTKLLQTKSYAQMPSKLVVHSSEPTKISSRTTSRTLSQKNMASRNSATVILNRSVPKLHA